MINVDPDIWLENPYDSNPAPGSAPGTVTGIGPAAGSANPPMTATATGANARFGAPVVAGTAGRCSATCMCADSDDCLDAGAVERTSDNPVAKLFRTIRERAMGVTGDDRGMSTVEYALGTVAAAAFGALLYTVVTGGQITDALTDIIERALNTQ